MDEFNSRIAAQRKILKIVNSMPWEMEGLLALTRKAIGRWVSANRVEEDCRLVQLIVAVSAKLFFLANKSQEQVSAEYRTVSEEISALCRSIELELSGWA